MKKLCVALLLLVSASILAQANPGPDLSGSTIVPTFNDGVIIAPGDLAGTTLTVTVLMNGNIPVPNAWVQVYFHPDVGICTAADLEAVSNQYGVAVIHLRGGGCINTPTSEACVIVANGQLIREFTLVKSPDNSSHGSSAPSGTVDTTDLTAFAAEFKLQADVGCHDYNNDSLCDTVDLTYFADAFKTSLSCALR